MRLETRPIDPAALTRLSAEGVHPVLARVFAGRGIGSATAIGHGLDGLIPPASLRGLDQAVDLLIRCIRDSRAICVVADYDCDGATACTVAMRGLAGMGAHIDYLVPNRLVHGYGLTPEIVALALEHPRLGRPDLLITVDNGIASHEGIAAANAAGLQVLVTDHHLPADTLPAAAAIVNPNQPDCDFPSKHLAGVGVIFYLLAALRARWREFEPDHPAARYPLAQLLDLVALGTVADLVRLDENNRRLVAAGLKTIRSGRGNPGIRALLTEAGRDFRLASTTDLGFTVGPRINAAGRLSDITLGIACLLTGDEDEAHRLAKELDSINRERRSIESSMHEQALASLEQAPPDRCSVTVHHSGWHEGVVGLVASRLKTRYGRPAFAFATSAADPAIAKGSGRSIAGIHLRDTLDLMVKRAPGLITRFGGHSMAAGLSLPLANVERFGELLESVIAETVDPALFASTLPTDGELDPALIDLPLVEHIDAQVWGQGFPAPLFQHEFKVLQQRIVGESHLKLVLAVGRRRFEAIAFRRSEPLPDTALLAWRPAINEYRGLRSLQLIVEAAEGD
jgi:single-stranded-DNA-specific exonuclease